MSGTAHGTPRSLQPSVTQRDIELEVAQCVGAVISPLLANIALSVLAERRGEPGDPLFPSRYGTAMSRDALERRLATHAASAARVAPTLAEKKVSPHVLRHTAAMRLLAAGVNATPCGWPTASVDPRCGRHP